MAERLEHESRILGGAREITGGRRQTPRAWGIFLLVAAAAWVWQAALLGVDGASAPSWASDDWAGYLANAAALLHGTAYPVAGYVQAHGVDAGTGSYPPGFPAMLVPALAAFGLDFHALALWGEGLAALALLAFMGLARREAGVLGAALGGIVLGFGPFARAWNGQVMSEFPFLLALFAALLADRAFIERGGGIRGARAAALAALVVLTRTVGGVIWPAAVLADWLRRRRLRWPVVAMALASALLAAAVTLAVDPSTLGQYMSDISANTAHDTGARGAPSLTARATLLADNVMASPGKLTVAWADGVQFTVLSPALALAVKAASALALLAGLAGLVRALRRPGTAEGFFVLEFLGLAPLPTIMILARVYLPLSVLLIGYGFAAARAAERRLGWRCGLRLALFALFLPPMVVGHLGLARQAAALQPARFSATEPRAAALLAWVRQAGPRDAGFLLHRARALALLSGRRAADPAHRRADAAFFAWARQVHAGYVVFSIDMPEVRARVPFAEAGNDAALNTALDRYQTVFFGSAAGRFRLAWRNDRFRVFRILPAG